LPGHDRIALAEYVDDRGPALGTSLDQSSECCVAADECAFSVDRGNPERSGLEQPGEPLLVLGAFSGRLLFLAPPARQNGDRKRLPASSTRSRSTRWDEPGWR
jgi:hypothetical protein